MNKMNFKFLLAVFVVAVALMPTAHSLSLTTKTSPDPTEPTSTLPPSTLPPSTASPSTASPSLASPTTDCQAGWSAFNGNCYKFFSEEKTWENAKDQCVEEQANLVSLHSEEEHQFVVGLNGGFPWLGGRRDPGNGNNFVWSDGTPWDYTNWARGAPDNNKGNEDCAHMKKKVAERHKWNDRPCSHVKTFVCKKGSNWLKVFSHDTAGGLFTSNTEALSKNPDDRAALLFSRLDELEDFRTEDGKFHLKIVYPELGGSNEWIQTSNPVTESTIEGFQPVKLDYRLDGHNNPWGGLGLHTGDRRPFISDTPTRSNWLMCIGCQDWWPSSGTIPGPRLDSIPKAVTRVDLYVNVNGYSGCQASPPSTNCQAGWSAFNGKCYKSFSEKKTWDEAEDECVKEEANLVSLHSEEEHQFVVGLNGGSGIHWLGGRRDHDNFVWSDGTPWDYNNWARGQPDNIAGKEGCALIWDVNQWNTVYGLWNDAPCNYETTFVCKKGPSDSVVETKPGLILSGGYPIDIAGTAVEVFVPSTGQHCRLPSLPGGSRADHSINENIVCGGGPYNSDPNYTGHDETRSSCVTLASDGTWLETTRLLEQRYHHSSWASPSGLILLGGRGSKRTTEKIQEDGSSSYSFELKYDLDLACSINLGSTVIVTGNRDQSLQTRVTEYSEAGFSRDLPSLQQGRYQHGCSYYDNSDGTKTLLVSGGFGHVPGWGYRSSTELLVGTASAWVFAGELPSPRWGLRGANIDNKILMTGGYDGPNLSRPDNSNNSDEILEFDPLTGQWELVGRMIQNRSNHAVTVTDTPNLGLCVE